MLRVDSRGADYKQVCAYGEELGKGQGTWKNTNRGHT